MLQQRHVRARIADVVEAAFPEALLERGQLVVPGQVGAAVAGEHTVKNADVLCHPLRKHLVRAGGQVQAAPEALLLLQKRQRLVVRQVRHIELHPLRYLALERGLALQDPPGDAQEVA